MTSLSRHSRSSTSPTGVLIPLYTHPTDDSWSEVAKVHASHPSVPIIAVINPSNGPGGSQNSKYVTGIRNLQNAGVTVLGYSYTKYGQRSGSSVELEVSAYKRWYDVNGMMFDGMSNTQGFESYYSALNGHSKSLGMACTVGNPGTVVPASFIGTLDCLVIYENSGLPPIAGLQRYRGHGASNFAYISYGVSKLDTSFETLSAGYVKWLYVTDAALPNPYDRLPPYFRAEVATLDSRTSKTAS